MGLTPSKTLWSVGGIATAAIALMGLLWMSSLTGKNIKISWTEGIVIEDARPYGPMTYEEYLRSRDE